MTQPPARIPNCPRTDLAIIVAAISEDLSDNLVVQLGSIIEDLNRRWFETNTGRRRL